MVTREAFVSARAERWRRLDTLLAERPLRARSARDISLVASLYRSVCADLMRARSLGLDSDLLVHLDELTGRAHNALYGPRPYSWRVAWDVVARRFPATLRESWRPFVIASLLFYGSLASGLIGALMSEQFAFDVLPRATLEQMAEGYSRELHEGRDIATNSTMAGFYVRNNIGIAFQCFATGVLFGVGSIFFLVYNGLAIGTTVGYVIRAGAGAHILTFICGHGPLELTAIVVSGTAGLRMGYALVETGGLTRLASLRTHGTALGTLIVGAAVLLLFAALIEGYWSPAPVPPQAKWAGSALAALGVATYLTLGGRRRRDAP